MTTTAVEPVRLQKIQIADASGALARAFQTNPGFVWTVPDDARRKGVLPWFMRGALNVGLGAGEVYTTAGAVEGVAIWLAPGKTTVTLMQLVQNGFFEAPFRLGWGGFRRFLAFMNRTEHLHKRDMPGDHWYLFVLGVDPPRQGQGIGSTLLQPVLAKADASGLPCYLETDKDIDVTFYRKHDFEVVVEERLPQDGPLFWTMRRPTHAR